jgi:hypothetical protein
LLALERLLSMNVLMVRPHGPRFGLDAETGNALLIWEEATAGLDAPRLSALLDMLCEQAADWRANGFLTHEERGAICSSR